MTKRSWNIDSLALIFSFIVVAQLLSYVIPHGEFDREPYPDNPNRTMVVGGTYESVSGEDKVSIPPWHFLLAIPKGMEAAQDIIFLIFPGRRRHRGAAQNGCHRCGIARCGGEAGQEPVDSH